ncbi:MAG TPA: sulfocyanin-like copper-binding protein [Trebonia sp.]
MTRKRNTILAGVAVLAAAGLGTGVAIAATGSSAQPPAPGAAASSATYSSPSYSWYRSMMSGYYRNGAGMMGGSSSGWMMSQAGYRWVTGNGAISPGWMTGALPPAMRAAGMMGAGMMGSGTDPGKLMGRLFAGAPGPRVSAAQAAALGNQIPAGAQVSRPGNTITFTTHAVRLTILASPSGGPDETFSAAGLVNPRIVIPTGAQVTIQLINADPDTAHGLLVTASDPAGSWMPMMTARPAFTGSALWFLGNPTSAGMHEGTLTFTAATPGAFHYLCPVPGHAREGMAGILTIG